MYIYIYIYSCVTITHALYKYIVQKVVSFQWAQSINGCGA